ncbi:histidinol-phosphate transaminase [Liquorilactobacillus satsumensis]|uniref:Histidinol-phosphate aminotransferase n=1 Tax=Liquorilactobacillus satsumensis DSM 16230 = JCM 12392 TaxID=1423801 RepID=A0A0R1UVS4_9LACO|nr:histidinol-phosphate transaminase [Liquorilactobacillus satsumensis]KRL97223.1 histidinol-phosphate aminotransferase [Liquorilactobacillus satsumensis DSM 16230 = JCM 12392]MCP9328648.1 histidinol-phosphate transaminase [Liquorilactobacillus satsumensis]
MSELNFRRQVDDCQPYIAGETEAAVLKKYHLESVVKLGSNENPYGPYTNARAALQESLQYLNRYPEDDYVDLIATIAAKNGLTSQNVALGGGAGNVIETTSRLFLDAGDEVLIATPTYRLYREVSLLMGASVKEVPVRSDFTADFEAFKAAITPKTKLIWLCNPNNPTGVVNDPQELTRFIDEVGDHVWIVLDEAYADFIQAGQRAQLTDKLEQKKLVIIRTFSKYYGLAGARVGYILARQKVISAYDTITEPFCVNRSGLFAARASLLLDQAEASEIKEKILQQKQRVVNELAQLEVETVPSQANFIFVKLPGKIAAGQIAAQLMAQGVIVRECGAWGYPQYLRITIGKAAENQRLITELKQLLRVKVKEQ